MGLSHSHSSGKLHRTNSGSNGYDQVDTFPVSRTVSLSECFLQTSKSDAVWSRFHPLTASHPTPRTGQFSAIFGDTVIVGCGEAAGGRMLNDTWLLELSTLQWRQVTFTGEPISPRTGIRGVICGGRLWLFGGVCDRVFCDDLFAVDLTSLECRKVATTGTGPSARRSPVFFTWGNQLFVWGGYNGSWPSELYSLDIERLEWRMFPQSVAGRSGTTYASLGEYGFCYAHQSLGGIIVIEFERNFVRQVETSGVEPNAAILNAALVATNNRLFLVGGKAESDFSLLYACDLRAMRWFVCTAMPDGVTVKKEDGQVDQNGLFEVPRVASVGVAYDERRRRIVTFLGRPLVDPTPLNVFDISLSLGLMNLQDDVRETLKLDILYP